ncbi:sensor histidine kinase [Paraferrimonas sedimenticola]|uniref:histidine kinase n=1 Tax=Paraferrimonas sedimenticola TaxID=375674 RepID=A0AA37W0E0_9GAMM|nr:HAMP domain-containing sensor histidine kinase [Paraferrimonas sedimenticola]GLP96190.1 hypothetical protein GCM10007895_14960 [Paraferrimonas sedimenticola]
MNSLFTRLLIATSLLLLLLFGLLWSGLSWYQQTSQQQVQQSLHRNLAEHMAHINPLLSQGVTEKAALTEALHDFMLLGPSFEIYTIGLDGQVIGYDAEERLIRQRQVDLAPVNAYLNGANLPILGTDPRNPNQKKIFSVAPLVDPANQPQGYLYVIIGGQQFDAWQALVESQQKPWVWAIAALGLILFSLLVFVLLVYNLTRPLARFQRDLRQLHQHKLKDGLRLSGPYQGSRELQSISADVDTLLTELNGQYQQAQAQQKARHEFLLHLSHDLKTPLTALLGYIDTWLVTPANQRDPELIRTAARSGQQLQRLLKQLLELAALENQQIVPKRQPLNLKPFLQDLADSYAPALSQKSIALDIDCERDTLVDTDPMLLQRILSNLMDNAIRHTPEQGQIRLQLHSQRKKLWITLTDSGSGFYQHQLDQLQRASARSTSQSPLPQLGVGLSIVQKLVALLEYRLEVESRPNQGTQIRIALS